MRKVWPIVTLCGSTRFKQEFLDVARDLTQDGYIVIMPGFFGHADGIQLTEQEKEMLDEMHKAKIDMSDSIFVINPGGYVGDSTKSEIDYALKHGLGVRYLVESRPSGVGGLQEQGKA